MPHTPPLFTRGLAVIAGFLLSHLSPAADPGVGEWTTFGNGPSHSGYYPKTIGSASFTAGWTKTFSTPVNQVAVSGDTIYATTNGYFTGGMRAFAMKVSDGSEKWSFPLADAYSVNPPTYANGRVYFQRGNHGNDTHLWCLDAASGTLRFAAPHAAQWERYAAPTIADGGAFVNGGYYGGMYGFDALTGAQRFFISNLAQVDGWTPSYAAGVVYSCVSGTFTAYNPQTGAQLWTRNLKTTSTGTSTYWDQGNIPVISDGKAAIVGGSRLLVIDLATRTQLWSLPGAYNGTPAFADGKVYAFLNSEVKVYNAANGTPLGTYPTSGTDQLLNQPLVTKDLVLASNGNRTFVFDRASFALRQTLNVGGSLSYAAGSLYVVNTPWSAPSVLSTFSVTPEESDPPASPLEPPTPPTSHPNPDRPLGTTSVAWLDAVKAGGIMYFLFDNPAKIERYNLATGDWLAPISLPAGPKGFNVSSTTIYVSFGTSTSKFPLDGTTETPLTTTATNIKSLFEINGRLYLANDSGSGFVCVDPTLGTSLGAKNFSYSMGGISVATTKNKILGRSTGVSPSDIITISINPDGSFGNQTDSPYHGDYPNATRTFLFPGEARVVDNAGIIYSASDLSYLGSLAGAFDDIDFDGDSAVVLRQNNTLVGYSASLAETGRKTIAASQLRISIAGGFVHSFARQNGRGVVATKTALNDIVPPDPGTGIDPTNVTYTPDAIEFGNDTVFLLSKLHQSIFRWSISQQRYLASISLASVPQYMTYSAALHRLYLSYAGGRLTKIDLTSGLAEQGFANLPESAVGLQTAGEYLFACDRSGWVTHYTFSPDGTQISAAGGSYFSKGYTWSEANRRMYFLRDDTSPNDLIWENIDMEGKIGLEGDSPYHGDYGVRHPIRISPNGSIVLLGNGDIYNALSLQRLGKLSIVQPPPASWPNYINDPAVVDAAWLNGTLYTVRGTYAFGTDTANGGMIESWDANYAATDSGVALGTPLRLNTLSDGLLLVSIVNGRPVFSKFNSSIDQVSSQPGNNNPPGSPITRANPARPLGPTSAAWVEYAKQGGIAYFFFTSPAKIERYEVATGNWLEPISLPDGPKSFAVTSGGIYVSFGKTISRFSLDGSTETLLISTSIDVRPLAERNGLVYIAGSQSAIFGAVDANTGLGVNEVETFYTMAGVSFSGARGKFFGRSSNVSPADIVMVALNSDGTFGAQSDSPYHGDYPNATRTILFPGEARVVDDAGIIYSTGDLTYLGSLGGAFTDIDFNGEAPILLRDNNTLVGYSAGLLQTGRKAIAANQLRIAVGGGFVHSFARQDGRGVVVTKTVLGDIVPNDPGPAIDPTSLTYTPDAIEFGGDTVFLLSKLHQSVFRWSISQNRYLSTIPLTEIPQFMAYSATLNRIYLSYPGGRITKVNVGNGTNEQEFVNLPQGALGLQTAGEYLFACDPSGAWATHYTYSPDGVLISAVDWNYFSRGYTWSATNRRMYFLRDDTSPNDLHWETIEANGTIGSEGESPYHGDYGVRHPIRVAPNGSTVLLGNGDVYNALSLQRLGKLAITQPPVGSPSYSTDPAVIDAAWLNGTLHTVRGIYLFGSTTSSDGMIESWNTSLGSTGSGASRGTPLRLNALTDGLLLVSLLDGRPVFAKYNAALTQISNEPGNNPPPGGPITRANPDRPLGPTSGPWIDAAKRGDIAYFLFDQPAKIERYNLATGAWLSPISLPSGPKYLSTGASGIYVNFGKSLSRFSFDGATETVLLSAASELRPLAELNGRIYVSASGTNWGNFRFGAVNVNTGIVTNEALYNYPLTGISFAPGIGKFFGRSTGVSPSDIHQVTLNSDGTLGAQTDSPYHGSYPNATQTFLSPGDGRVLDNSGTVYSTSNLQFLGSVGGAFTDADFAGEQLVVLRNGSLVAYSSAFQEAGRKVLSSTSLRIFATNDTIVSFGAAASRGVEAVRTGLSSITSPQPPDPIDPTDLVYTPDSIELGKNGVVYLLSKLHQSVFRWSIDQNKYLTSIQLSAVPQYMAYSVTLDRLYLANTDGKIRKIDVAQQRVEQPFATLPGPTTGLQTAGEFLFVTAGNSTETIHYALSPGGAILSSGFNDSSSGFTWSAANRRMYYLKDTIHWVAIDSNGVFGQRGESQYYSGFPAKHPVRVAPNGATLVLGNGDVYDAVTLQRLGSLAIHGSATQTLNLQIPLPVVVDAAWFKDELFTVRNELSGGVIQRWSADRQLSAAANVPGAAMRMFAMATDDLLLISIKDGRPLFTRIDPDLGTIPDPDPINFADYEGTFLASLFSQSGAVTGPTGGLVKLKLTAGGTASGNVRIGGKTVSFQVTFDQFGHATVPLSWKGQACTLTLTLTMGSSGPRVSGSLEADFWSLALNGARAMEVTQPGRHLFLITDSNITVRTGVPPVVGRGAMTISRNGSVRIRGSLFLGGAVTQGSMVLEDGSIVLNLATSRKTGFIAGTVNSINQPNPDWSGTLRWFNQANPKAARYPNEINTTVGFSGARYTNTKSILPVGKDRSVVVFINSGDLEELIEIRATLDPSGVILPEFDDRLDYAVINPVTGLMRGYFMHPVTNDWVPFSGIVNRNLNEAQGGFLGPKHGGQVQILPDVAQ